jgi:flagellar hook-basal body complex protein FliE
MNTIDTTKLLNELRALQAQARGETQLNKPANSPGFGQVMSKAINTVNDLQMQSGDLQRRVEMGDRSVSLVQAMIASQKANIGLQATIQVRNRLVSAYQDVFNMPI